MYLERHVVSITTAAGGGGTGYTPVVNGRILAILYVKTDYDNGVTFAITGADTATPLWSEVAVNATATRCPRTPTHDVVGAASLYAAGGEPVEDHIAIVNERVKIVVSAGGATKTGTFHVIVG